MPDGQCTITIDSNDSVSGSPDEATPDANNNLVFTLVDNSGHGWCFADTNPIIIANPQNFTVTRNSGSQLTVTDSGLDRANIPTHKYTMRFTRPGRPNPMIWDPTIRDRVTN